MSPELAGSFFTAEPPTKPTKEIRCSVKMVAGSRVLFAFQSHPSLRINDFSKHINSYAYSVPGYPLGPTSLVLSTILRGR